MPGLVKIGYTTKVPELRGINFDGTHSPHLYRVEFDIPVKNPRALEQKIHAALKDFREGKEGFRCSFAHTF
jgi:hypothetical protein